jgi:hypothetical protein
MSAFLEVLAQVYPKVVLYVNTITGERVKPVEELEPL